MIACDGIVALPPPGTAFVRCDGMRLGMALPFDLAGALVGVRCGGAFIPAPATGMGGTRVADELTAAILAAADATWPGSGDWSPAAADPAAAAFGIDLTIAGCPFILLCSVTLAPTPPAAAADHSGWTRSLRDTLDATPFAVRAVLHENIMSLGEALGLRVGDILPIETRRDVSLRLGDRALARGTIAPDDDGGHRVTIAAVGAAGVTPAPPEEFP